MSDSISQDIYGKDPFRFEVDPSKAPQTTWATGSYNQNSPWSGESEELAAMDYVKDLAASPLRGAESFVQGLYGLADVATLDALPDYRDENRLFGTSKTLAGGIAEGLVSFAIPFSALGWAGKAGKLGQFGKWIGKDTLVSELVRGGIVDFAAFEGSDGRLSDIVKGSAFENPITEYLASDMDDSELEGRLKNLAEGALIGVPLDLVFNATKMARTYKQARGRGATQSEAAMLASGIGEELIENYLNKRLNDSVREERKALGLELDEASPVPQIEGAGKVDQKQWVTTVNDLVRSTKVLQGLEGSDRAAVETLVQSVGVRMFDDVKVEWKTGADQAAGSYDYVRKTVTLYSDALVNGSVPKTLMHELWHSLEDSLSSTEVSKIRKQFLDERAEYFARNPEAKKRFDGLTSAQTSAERDFAIGKILASNEYQYVSPSEWWAAKATDTSAQRLEKLQTIKDGGIRGLLAQAQMFWSDFVASLRNKFGLANADSIVSEFMRGKKDNVRGTVDRLRYYGEAYNVSTAYARIPSKLPSAEFDAMETALKSGQEKGLSGLDLAVTIPYTDRIHGLKPEGITYGKGINLVAVTTEEGVRGANVFKALAVVAKPDAGVEASAMAFQYLKTIGVDIDNSGQAVEIINRLISDKRFEVKEMLGAKAKGKAKAEAATEAGAEALGQAAASEGKTVSKAKSAAELRKDVEAADVAIDGNASLSAEDKVFQKVVSRLQIHGNPRKATAYLTEIGTDKAKISKIIKKAKDLLGETTASQRGGIGVSRQAYSVKGVKLDFNQAEVDKVLSAIQFTEPKMSMERMIRSDYAVGSEKHTALKAELAEKASAAAKAKTEPAQAAPTKVYTAEDFPEEAVQSIADVIIRTAKDPNFKAMSAFEKEVQNQFSDIIDALATDSEMEFMDVYRQIDDMLFQGDSPDSRFQRVAQSREAAEAPAESATPTAEAAPTAAEAPTEAIPEATEAPVSPVEAGGIEQTATPAEQLQPEIEPETLGDFPSTQTNPVVSDMAPTRTEVDSIIEAKSAEPEAAAPTEPPQPPAEAPQPPSGERQRRSPEEIGQDPNPLTRDDADDLIEWAFSRPQSNIENINPRELDPAEQIAAWLDKRQLNFGRLILDRREGSFLRTIEEFGVARMQSRDPIGSLENYSPKQMQADGIEVLANASSVPVWQFAKDLKVHARSIEDVRGKLFIGRVLMLTMNKEITRDLMNLKAALEIGDSAAANPADLVEVLAKVEALGEMVSAVRGVSTGAGRLLHSLRSRAVPAKANIDWRINAERQGPQTLAQQMGTQAGSGPRGSAQAKPKNAMGNPGIGINPNDLLILQQLRRENRMGELTEVLNQMGGHKKVYDTVKKIHEVVQSHIGASKEVPDHVLAKIGTDAKSVGFWDFHNEYWINSLVSSSVTILGVNLISSAMTSTLIPLERIIGGALTSNKEAFSEGVNTYKAMMSSVIESLGVAAESIKTDTPIGVGRRVDNFRPKAFSRQNIPLIDKLASKATPSGEAATKATADFLFNALSMPMRLIQGGDEFFKQVNYRGNLKAKLMTSLKQQGLPQSEIDNRLKDLMDFAVTNNEFVTNERLLREGLDKGRATLGTGATVQDLEQFARAYRDTQWLQAGALDPQFGEIAERSMSIAKEATLQADPRFGAQKAVTGFVQKNPWARLFLPFVSTPINALVFAGDRMALPLHVKDFVLYARGKRIAELSQKAGLPEFVGRWALDQESRIMRDLNSPDPAARSEALGRTIVGASFFGAIFALAANGNITGYGPSNREERKTWIDRGNRPYSIKIGDQLYSFSRLDPVSTMMGTVADLALATKYARHDSEALSMLEAVGQSTYFALTNNLTNKSYLQGLKTFVDMIGSNDPALLSKWFKNQAGTYLPYSSMMQTVARMADKDRRIPEASLWDGIYGSVTKRIPGLSDELPPARDMFGKPVQHDEAFGPDLISPIATNRIKNDAVSKEIVSLERAFSVPNRRQDGIDLSLLTIEGNRNAYDRFQELVGQTTLGGKNLEEALTALITSDRYQRMTREATDFVESPRVYAIRSVFAKYRMKAYAQLKQESKILKDLTGQINAQERDARMGIAPTILKPY